MKYRYIFHLPKHYDLRGFEIDLAQLELQTLVGPQIDRGERCFILETTQKIDPEHLTRLTFIERIEILNEIKTEVLEPFQVAVDRTAAVDNGAIIGQQRHLFPSIRVSRRTHNYLTHALHQYKGKFYPQIAKSLINYAGLQPGSVVLDPFCGSGTTLVECLLNGYTGLGVDLNPLAALMAQAKVDTLLVDPEEAEAEISGLIKRIQQQYHQAKIWDEGLDEIARIREEETAIHLKHLRISNKDYLKSWFEPIALYKLVLIRDEIEKIPDPRMQNFAKVVLSDIVRDYSLQAPGQLRVRRRKTPPDHNDLLLKYRNKLLKHTRSIAFADVLGLHDRAQIPPVRVFQADVTELDQIPSEYFQIEGQIDAIITSPPYATALPYIDTDRLSLFFLDLLKKDERKDLEWDMIGNREIVPKKKRELEAEFLDSYETNPLPLSVKELIREVLERNRQAEVGFRRKNKASLLYKYFKEMRQAFIQFYRVLKPGRLCSVIIGNNKTTAGGKLIKIPTDDFLIEIGQSVGFRLVEKIPMTDQPAYMAHSKNVIDTETIFILERA
jgi:DNA modification methylase